MFSAKYYSSNIIHILCTVLVSVFFVLLVFPFIINLEFIKKFLNTTDRETFVALTAIISLCFICLWHRTQNFFIRYKNTYKLETPAFIYIDHLILFVITSTVLIISFQHNAIPYLSSEFKFFVIINITLFTIWFLLAYYWKNRNRKIFYLRESPRGSRARKISCAMVW